MIAIKSGFRLERLATLLAIAILSLGFIAAFSGILLSFNYEPTAGGAYNSLKLIQAQIPFGWLMQRLHAVAGNGLILVALVQIFVLFFAEKFCLAWLISWISGILLALTAIGLGWTAMLLDWTQLGYWRFTIELGTLEALPYIGPTLRQIIVGGGAVNTTTVAHLYTLHSYVLATAAAILSILHLIGLLYRDKQSLAATLSPARH